MNLEAVRGSSKTRYMHVIVTALVMCLIMSTTVTTSFAASVTVVKQSGNALAPFSLSELGVIKNTNIPVKAKTKTYARSKGMKPSYPFETKPNTYKPKKYSKTAKKYTFKTSWFLPVTYKKSGDWAGPQSMAFSKNGRYIYVVLTEGEGTNKGRIIRYDTKVLNKYKLSKKGKNLEKLRWATYDNFRKKATKAQKKILKGIKVGPVINIGHGQSLSLNPATGELWMWKDEQNKNKTWKDPNDARIQRINPKTLKPDVELHFKMYSTSGIPIGMGHNLTFDSTGTGYFVTTAASTGYLKLYSFVITAPGTVTETGTTTKWSTEVELRKQFEHAPSKGPIQGLSYNSKTDLLNVVSDDVYMAFPASKVSTLVPSDITYVQYGSKREFESITYDPSGYAYLLLNRGPEILKSTKK